MRQYSDQRPATGCHRGGLHEGGGPSKIDVGSIPFQAILFSFANEATCLQMTGKHWMSGQDVGPGGSS